MRRVHWAGSCRCHVVRFAVRSAPGRAVADRNDEWRLTCGRHSYDAAPKCQCGLVATVAVVADTGPCFPTLFLRPSFSVVRRMVATILQLGDDERIQATVLRPA